MAEVDEMQDEVLESAMKDWRVRLADIAPGYVPASIVKTAIVNYLAESGTRETEVRTLEAVVDAGVLGAVGVQDALESLRKLGLVTISTDAKVRLNEQVLD